MEEITGALIPKINLRSVEAFYDWYLEDKARELDPEEKEEIKLRFLDKNNSV